MKIDIKLSEREEAILSAVIDLYVKSAEPVGSRLVASRYALGLSPATIRNTMQDLEERGLLRQPHTSAGRVPTDLGYRYFVDRLLRPVPLSRGESAEIRKEVGHDPAVINDILAQTAKVLARLTNQLGVTVSPAFEKGVLSKIDLVPVANNRVLVIIAVRSGLARTLLLEMDTEIPAALLEETCRTLNERLERLRDAKGEPRLVKLFLESSDRLVTLQEVEDLHLGGTANMMAQPEFRDIKNLTGLMHVIEDRTHLLDWFTSQGLGSGIVITIGKEFAGDEEGRCSLVTSSYRVGQVEGTIGVLGPTRMPYNKLVSVVEYTSRVLTDVLSG